MLKGQCGNVLELFQMRYVDLQAKVKLAIERWQKWIQGWTDHWAWGPFSEPTLTASPARNASSCGIPQTPKGPHGKLWNPKRVRKKAWNHPVFTVLPPPWLSRKSLGFTVGHKRSEPNRGPSLECPIATGSAVSSQILWWIINVDFFYI